MRGIEEALSALLGSVAVEGLQQLPGGASRETWSFDAVTEAGERSPRIAQRSRPALEGPADMAPEAALLRLAGVAGVPVPQVLAADGDLVVVERLEGETIPRRVLRSLGSPEARRRLTLQCAAAAAAIHAIPPTASASLEDIDQVAQYREALDTLGEPHPAFELGFRWLEANRPPQRSSGVVHGDFRLGNLLVAEEGLVAVLDWELAHLGDPLEDLAWLCVKSWRFGAAPRVGGFGDLDDLVGAYEAAGGTPVDRGTLAWWEVLGTLKWGIMCVGQAATHLDGVVRSVELAAIGRRVCEVEHDLLLLLP